MMHWILVEPFLFTLYIAASAKNFTPNVSNYTTSSGNILFYIVTYIGLYKAVETGDFLTYAYSLD